MNEFESNNNTDIEYARTIRKKRSEIKSDLKAGKITLQELFNNEEVYRKYITNIRAIELVGALPGFGMVKAEKLLRNMSIGLCKKIGGLGKNQKKKFYKYFNIQAL